MNSSGVYDRVRMRFYKQRVVRTLRSGVKPIVLRYCQVNACDSNLPVAYRTSTVINSTTMGVLTPKEYRFSCDSTDSGLRIAEWNVGEAMRHITKFVEAGRNIDWISVRCPSELAVKVDMYEWMRRLIRKNGFKYPQKLCLEFPVSLLSEKTAAARLSVLDMKLLGVRTMLSGCGGADCPTSRLVQIPVDMVLLTSCTTELTGNRNKKDVIPSLISYLRSMRVEVYAEGVTRDDQISTLNRSDCLGYMIGKGYEGKKALPFGRNMSFAAALAQKDTEDDFEL